MKRGSVGSWASIVATCLSPKCEVVVRHGGLAPRGIQQEVKHPWGGEDRTRESFEGMGGGGRVERRIKGNEIGPGYPKWHKGMTIAACAYPRSPSGR